MDWHPHYPQLVPAAAASSAAAPRVEFLDIGCGFGGLLFQLAPHFPTTLMLGLEIRVQVTAYVHDKIWALRLAHRRAQAAKRGEVEDAPAGEGVQGEGGDVTAAQGEGNGDAAAQQPSAGPSSPAQRPAKRAKGAKGAPVEPADDDELSEEDEREMNAQLVRGAGDVPGGYENISVLRSNAMKFLPNFFERGQVSAAAMSAHACRRR
jgi:tRNA (guanine-N7-)-methyltransferase